MISVPGRSSVEKNISFFIGFLDLSGGDFLSVVVIVDWWISIYYRENLSSVKKTHTFSVAYYIKTVLDTFLCTEIFHIYMEDIYIFAHLYIYPYEYIFLVGISRLYFLRRREYDSIEDIARGFIHSEECYDCFFYEHKLVTLRATCESHEYTESLVSISFSCICMAYKWGHISTEIVFYISSHFFTRLYETMSSPDVDRTRSDRLKERLWIAHYEEDDSVLWWLFEYLQCGIHRFVARLIEVSKYIDSSLLVGTLSDIDYPSSDVFDRERFLLRRLLIEHDSGDTSCGALFEWSYLHMRICWYALESHIFIEYEWQCRSSIREYMGEKMVHGYM